MAHPRDILEFTPVEDLDQAIAVDLLVELFLKLAHRPGDQLQYLPLKLIEARYGLGALELQQLFDPGDWCVVAALVDAPGATAQILLAAQHLERQRLLTDCAIV